MFASVEWQADTMGASLLMPRRIIENALAKYNQSNPIKVYGDNTITSKDKAVIRLSLIHILNAIQLPNTKIKILQRLLSQAIDEFKKVNKIMGVEFADRLKKVVDEYNNRRRDEAYANEVLDDVAEQLAQLLSELKTEKNSFKNMGIDYEEKACLLYTSRCV